MAGDEICLVVHPADELALCSDDAGPYMVEFSFVWQLMPQKLLDRILLFVPASSQARLRCVCKRWSQLMTSSAFRKESELIAFRLGHRNFLCCTLKLARAKEAGNYTSGGALYKVDMPGATTSVPGLDINSLSLKVFCGAGLVGVAHMSLTRGGILDCWVLNVANRTCRQLPRLFLSCSCSTAQRCRWKPSWGDWRIWLEPAPESSGSSDTLSSFRVVLMAFHPSAVYAYGLASPALYTYSSTSTDWRSVHHLIRPHPKWRSCALTEAGYVSWFRDIGDSNCKRVRITQLPDPPLGVDLISDPSTAAVLGWKVDESTFSLYRLDESSGWRCLYSGLPPQLHPTRIHVQAKKILGNMLILVCSIWENSNFREQHAHCLAMAYHMHDGSCKWFRLPARAFLYSWECYYNCKSVFLEPTLVSLVSHLRL